MRLATMTALILAMLLGISAEASDAYVIVEGPVAALVDARGEGILSGEGISDIREVGAQLYAAGDDGEYALYDARGNRFCEGTFDMAWQTGDVLILKQDGLYGAMDLSGAWIIEPEWTQLVYDGSGSFLALSGDPLDTEPDGIVCLQEDAKSIQTGKVTTDGLHAFADGLMPYRDENGLYGYLNAAGNPAIQAAWQYAGDYENGTALVSDGAETRLIDTKGRALTVAFPWVKRGSEIVGALREDGSAQIMRADDGQRIFAVQGPVRQLDIVGNAAAVTIEDKTTLYDAAGEVLCTASGQALFSMGLDGQIIASDGVWGERCQWLIAPDGGTVSQRFQRILPLCAERYAYMEMSGVEYYSSALDEMQISWDYDSIRFGLLDSEGNVLLPAAYRQIRACGEDRLLLVEDNWVRFADPEGTILRSWHVD